MDNLLPPLLVLLSGSLFCAFPGILLSRYLFLQDFISRVIFIIFFSLGFWVCVAWFISLLSLPLDISVGVLLAVSIIGFIVQKALLGKRSITSTEGSGQKMKTHHWALIIAILLLCYPLTFISIPPGCDTAMHGYITRLIINNDGLPHSYRPILPVDYFGSYSAGYHILTAMFSWFKVGLLRHAINLISVMVYPLALLGIIFFFRQFFSERTAVFTAIIFWGLNSTLQNTISWGGNPTMLAFGACMFTAGIIVYAIKEKSSLFFILSAIPLATIPLIHAIPAVTFAYMAPLGYCILLYHFKDSRKWLLINTATLVVATLLLLTPFLIHFRNENSPELLQMIKDWQNKMMGSRLTGNVGSNLLITLDEIKYRIGELPVILAGVCMIALLVFRRYRQVVITLCFLAMTYVLIFNYGYWFLPLSELLYPERIVFFTIIIMAFFLGYMLQLLEDRRYNFSVFHYNISVYSLLVLILFVCSGVRIYNTSQSLKNSAFHCDEPTMQAFDWINSNTPANAMLVASYNDAGMWIPTFTNRATLGTHLHFIHLVQHIPEKMKASKVPQYIFVTQRDVVTDAEILKEIPNKQKVFVNSSVTIYH